MSQARHSSFRVYVDILGDEKPVKEMTVPAESESDSNSVRTDMTDTNRQLSSTIDQEINPDHGASTVLVDNDNHDHVQPSVQTEHTLCGYLNKRRLGTKLNQYKKRWFVYRDSTCQLLYYKTQNDPCPLGQIDVSCATLTTELECERSHVFKISSRNAVYLLQAPDEQTMVYWVQELQKNRKIYNKMKYCFAKESLTTKSIQQPEKGLVKSKTDAELEEDVILPPSGPSLMEKVQIPPVSPTTATNEQSNSHSAVELKKMRSRSQTFREQSSQAFVTLRRKLSKQNIVFGKSRADRCSQCKKFETRLASEMELIKSLQEDLDAKDKVIATLKNHIITFMASLDIEDTSAHGWQTSCEHDDISHSDTQCSEKKKDVDTEYQEHLQEQLEDYKDNIDMYQEIIKAKDSVIESLTKRLDELECYQPDSKHSSSESMIQLQNLQDAYDAYRKQNTILNQEILELSILREQDEIRERALRVNYAKLEADYYCVKSKYLVCLRDLDRPRLAGGEEEGFISQEMVSSLLQEAMDSEAKSQLDRPNIREHQKYDKYGFWFMPNDANTDVQSRADSLLRMSDELSAKTNSMYTEISTRVKWENFMQKQDAQPLERSQELKQLIRLGIPAEYREKIWNFCVSCQVGTVRTALKQDYYSNLLKRGASSTSLNPAVTQIELDLLRTLPNNRYYECLSSDGIPKLRNVLLAYSIHKPEIGYCQGLNRLAAIALLFLDEEDAFWCLVAILDHIMPKDYYTRGLLAAHIDQRVLKDLIADKTPKVHSVLEQQEVDLALFTFNWFMTLFVDNIPVETYLHIWDTFLFEGSKVLFRFAVAFLLYEEEEIVKTSCANSLELHHCLRSVGQHITDVHKVSQIAFHNINPFPMKYITARRNYHRSVLQAEFEDLQETRESFHEVKAKQNNIHDGTTDNENSTLI